MGFLPEVVGFYFKIMKEFFTKKRIIYIAIGLAVLGLIGFLIARSGQGSDVLTQEVKSGDLQKTVVATGQVISSTDVDLSFKTSGIVESVNVKVGQAVEEGEILASLDAGEQAAQVTQARASLAQAQANYDKIVAGADTPEVNIAKSAVAAAEVTLRNAQASYNATAFQQNALVTNARLTYFNSGLEAKRRTIVDGEVTATITGAYQGEEAGYYEFEREFSVSSYKLRYRGLENGLGTQSVVRGIPTPLGTKGLFVTFSTDGSFSDSPEWRVDIPNVQAANYLTNLNAYTAAQQARDLALITAQNSVNAAQSALDQANYNLDQTLAAARPEDVAVAKAQILSAQGQLESAAAALESTIIRAPAKGTITAIEVDAGEAASPTKPSITLKDLENLYVEANIAEANIGEIKLDQDVRLTFDALGSDRVFAGKVAQIDPASTLVSGIVNYKIKASVEKIEEIKPGMTANLTIVTNFKANVLSVPESAVIEQDGKKVVRVVTNSKTKDYVERLVTTGIRGDGGMIEITSGLEAGQEIIIDPKD
jgi:HlyD family secretion protein